MYQFCDVFVHIKMKSLGKEVILSLKSLKNHSQISVRTLCPYLTTMLVNRYFLCLRILQCFDTVGWVI